VGGGGFFFLFFFLVFLFGGWGLLLLVWVWGCSFGRWFGCFLGFVFVFFLGGVSGVCWFVFFVCWWGLYFSGFYFFRSASQRDILSSPLIVEAHLHIEFYYTGAVRSLRLVLIQFDFDVLTSIVPEAGLQLRVLLLHSCARRCVHLLPRQKLLTAVLVPAAFFALFFFSPPALRPIYLADLDTTPSSL